MLEEKMAELSIEIAVCAIENVMEKLPKFVLQTIFVKFTMDTKKEIIMFLL